MQPKWMLENNLIPFFPEFSDGAGEAIGLHSNVLVPGYLSAHYWWAYIDQSLAPLRLEVTETLVGIDEQNNPLILFDFVT